MVSQVKPLSNVRRIQRLLELKLFSNTTLGRAIVNALPRQKKYILTMDRTACEPGKRDYNTVAMGYAMMAYQSPYTSTPMTRMGHQI